MTSACTKPAGAGSAPKHAVRLRVASCLAPHLCAFYRDVACALGDLLGEPAFFVGDAAYEELAEVDIAFVCSLAYLEHPEIAGRFEPVAAPVLAAPRYGDEPVYWSDVIVRADSGLRGFADLRGRSWAFNEPYSQSGHGITRYHLTRLGATQSYFSRVIEAGRHDRCIGLVLSGEVDAAAIDSHVLETYFHAYPELELAMRVIDSLGPSPIQPVVVRRDLSRCRKDAIRAALVDLGHHPHGRDLLRRALVARFVAVDDSTYHPVRIMRDVAHAAGFAVLR